MGEKTARIGFRCREISGTEEGMMTGLTVETLLRHRGWGCKPLQRTPRR